jgi:hypothetical protein
MKIKLTKTKSKDLGVVRHQIIPKKIKGKKVSFIEAEEIMKDIAKELGYKQILFYQEHEKGFEFRLLSRDKKWVK